MYNAVIVQYIHGCSTVPSAISEHFFHPQRKFYTQSQSSPFPSYSYLLASPDLLSIRFASSEQFIQMESSTCGILGVASKHVSRFIFLVACINISVLLWSNNILLGYTTYCLSMQYVMGCIPLSAVKSNVAIKRKSNAALNICVWVFVQAQVFSSC